MACTAPFYGIRTWGAALLAHVMIGVALYTLMWKDSICKQNCAIRAFRLREMRWGWDEDALLAIAGGG